MHLLPLVVPIQHNSNVSVACTVCCYLVVLFERLFFMDRLFLTFILDSIVVHYSGEFDELCVVLPRPGTNLLYW